MKTIIYAHRGASGTYPENTMTAFQAALALGADGIEFDIQLTKDDVPVIIHDATIDRTTDGRGAVAQYTSAELATFNAAARDPKLTPERIPTLAEVLAWASRNPSFLLNIEVKAFGEERGRVVAAVSRVLQQYNVAAQLVISSFDHLLLVQMKEAHSEIEIAALTMGSFFQPEKYLASLGANGYHLWSPFVKEELIRDLTAHGIVLRPFTVNDEQEMHRFISWGCPAIFTDFPERAVKIRV